MSSKTVECDLCGETILKSESVETSNEDGDIVYVCKDCAENEEETS